MPRTLRAMSPDDLNASSPKRRIAKVDEDTYSDISQSSRNGTPDGYDSPRTSVARTMGHLSLRETRLKQQSHSPSPSKRARIGSKETKATDGPVIFVQESGDSDVNHIQSVETEADSSSSSINPESLSPENLQPPTTNRSKRFRSPPPPNATELGLTSEQSESAFWNRADITGQILDLAAGDDGEGINGIGFRPTTQAAFARKQRRKQQVNEWKAREAREARQRRFERRHGCHQTETTFAPDFAQRPRVVRFAEAL